MIDWIKGWPPRVWVALVLLVLSIVFIVQNRQDAIVRLASITVTAPMWITLLVCVLVGVLICLLGWRKP